MNDNTSGLFSSGPDSGIMIISRQSVEYVDILEERRNGSDLRWAAREWEPDVVYKHSIKMTPKELCERVLKSDRVQATITKLVEDGQDEATLRKNAAAILDQMGHTLNIGMIRRFAISLSKIMKRIYGKILVNKAGIDKLKSVVEETPVLFLPTHRSYADFLLVSYVAFHFNVPVPAIVAGMDFMNMAIVGDMLRGAGAFFIRRSFMDDSLYWAVFQEYVQSLVYCMGGPVEFFLEGTRSRSGKSLPPKLGVLGSVAECWLRGTVPNLYLIPFTISYNRTLEEKLYAYELLGVPKPQESTSGLLKAMKILKENFGNIYINIGDPVSMREMVEPHVSRHLTASYPRHITSLSKQELVACEALGLHVLRKLQAGSVTSVWSLACITLLQSLWSGSWTVHFLRLHRDVECLVSFLQKAGISVDLEGRVEEELRHNLTIHQVAATLGEDGVVYIQKIHHKGCLPDYVRLQEKTVENAVTQILLQHYVNQVMHHLIRPALLAFVLTNEEQGHSVPVDLLQEKFQELCFVFSSDFIFEKNKEQKDFMEGLHILIGNGDVGIVHNSVQFVNRSGFIFSTLLDILRPFLITYQSAVKIAESKQWPSEAALVEAIQMEVEKHAEATRVYSALSLDTVRLAVRMLNKTCAITKELDGHGNCQLTPNKEKLQELKLTLGKPGISEHHIKAKL